MSCSYTDYCHLDMKPLLTQKCSKFRQTKSVYHYQDQVQQMQYPH